MIVVSTGKEGASHRISQTKTAVAPPTSAAMNRSRITFAAVSPSARRTIITPILTAPGAGGFTAAVKITAASSANALIKGGSCGRRGTCPTASTSGKSQRVAGSHRDGTV
jgi:hypothetical protein